MVEAIGIRYNVPGRVTGYRIGFTSGTIRGTSGSILKCARIVNHDAAFLSGNRGKLRLIDPPAEKRLYPLL